MFYKRWGLFQVKYKSRDKTSNSITCKRFCSGIESFVLYAKYVFYPGIRNLVYVKFSPIAIEQFLAHDFWKEKKTFMEHRNRKNVILA